VPLLEDKMGPLRARGAAAAGSFWPKTWSRGPRTSQLRPESRGPPTDSVRFAFGPPVFPAPKPAGRGPDASIKLFIRVSPFTAANAGPRALEGGPSELGCRGAHWSGQPLRRADILQIVLRIPLRLGSFGRRPWIPARLPGDVRPFIDYRRRRGDDEFTSSWWTISSDIIWSPGKKGPGGRQNGWSG